MAMFHVSVDRIVKGKGEGGATGFAQYIAREQLDKATQHARYLVRESHPEKDDLVAAGAANLPSWVKDATHFFAMADRYERHGGIVARTYEIALPRELTPTQRQELADDIRTTFFDRHPHAWAIHNPVARDGQEQPHMHIMVSERLIDGIERSPQQFFRRAAAQETEPAAGGAKKEIYWNTRASLTARRAGMATLTNAALERAGQEVAVSHETLKARGHDRAPEVDQGSKARYLHARHGIETPGWQATLARRDTLRRDFYPWENELNRAAWHVQKQREGITDLRREAIVEHVRERFWAHDHSPTRELEQANALVRQVDREYAKVAQPHRGQGLAQVLVPEEPVRRPGLQARLRARAAAHEQAREDGLRLGW
jgi:MobA/MobL family